MAKGLEFWFEAVRLRASSAARPGAGVDGDATAWFRGREFNHAFFLLSFLVVQKTINKNSLGAALNVAWFRMNSWAGELSISQGKGSHYKSRLGLGTGGALLGSHSAASPVLVGLVDQLGSDGRCTRRHCREPLPWRQPEPF